MRQVLFIVYQCMRPRGLVIRLFSFAHSRELLCSKAAAEPALGLDGRGRPSLHGRITAAEVFVSGYDSSSQPTNIEENAA